MIAAIFRYLSYGFNLVIAAGMLALGLVAKFSSLDLKLEMLPWSGSALTAWLIGLGIVGLIIVGLSMFGILRWLLLVWSVFIIVMWARAIWVPGWTFDGQDPFKLALQGLAGYLVICIGAVFAARQK